MRKKIGFIGAGNMGTAIMKGILKNGLASKDQVIASCHTEETKNRIASELGIEMTLDNCEAANADIVFFAVKPNVLPDVAAEVKHVLTEDQLIISIAAGFDLKKLHFILGGDLHIIRSMPNTPAMVGEAMSALCSDEKSTDDDRKTAIDLFNSFGKAEFVPESLMDAVTGVSGSSPAFIYMVIEAMADAAVAEGMPRKQAYIFAAQSVLGSAKMVLDTGRHPGELKDAVTSPSGTTIEGVAALERDGLRAAMIDAVRTAAQKSRDLSK
ncbi:MAG: pyrroline-5-carboxylate reductase [Lachnospiraceae bacterium]|uniref:Pyrroline-5-carboxylate reductase n=1 Tax=Candidatus Weimeria bifida TaxID=2599074 RepID=A0A6N7IXD6_9FIRM|nr:pyrroline-5-carboxylate reductase [Candidatus Weimeria bifida]RRF94882.1 MAG: pyrroline-5-carboxylate reductase [Lachnospiraceae bacterium]